MVLFDIDTVLFQPFSPSVQNVLILRRMRGFAHIRTDMFGDLPFVDGFLDLGAVDFGIPRWAVDRFVFLMGPN